MLWELAVYAAALGAAYYRWSRRRLYRLAREIPSGLKEYPIVGHAYMFLGSSEDRMESLQEFGRIANRQGGLSSFWLGNRLYVNMTEPKSVEVASRACLDKDEFTVKHMRYVTGNGSLFAPLSIWHPRRKINATFFNIKNLNQLVPLFQVKSSIMVDLMRAEAGGGDFPLWKYVTTYTFDTVGESVLGMKIDSQENPEHIVLRAVDKVCHMMSERFLQPWLHPDFVYKRLPLHKQFAYFTKKANDFVIEAIHKRHITEEVGLSNEGWMNFLETIIRSSGGRERGYSDEELREEALVVMVAGNDTSAVGMSFAAVLLSRQQTVQEKVYQELIEVFGDSNREIVSGDLPRLKYVEAVIKESLRLYPPVPMITREARKDVLLPSGSTLVDGTSMMFNIWGTHRNPVYWGADAELFRPERFLEGPLRHPAQFIPFSYSMRNCIGAPYAMMSMKTGLANLLRRYRLLPPANMAAADLTKPLRVKYDIMMKAVDNFTLRVEERNKII